MDSHIKGNDVLYCLAKLLRSWMEAIGVKNLFVDPGSPWENGYNASFNGKLSDELLNGKYYIL